MNWKISATQKIVSGGDNERGKRQALWERGWGDYGYGVRKTGSILMQNRITFTNIFSLVELNS